MTASKKFWYVTVGLVLGMVGAASSFIMFLQPWRSCPEIDDSSAGCPATESDLALFGLAIALLLVGVAFLIMAARPEHIPSEAAGSFGKLG